MYDDLKNSCKYRCRFPQSTPSGTVIEDYGKHTGNNDYSAKEVTDMFNGALDAIRHLTD